MSTSTTVQLTLPRCNDGSRKIRFIYMVDQTSFRLSECPNKGPVVPLYLGADLFFNTDIRTENHPRYHAKFAKKGLATKITFSSAFRFHELKVPSTSNSLWFYSIQGLFRVAFELYSKQEQLEVLENFQEVWKSQIHDNPLQMSYNLCVQHDPSICNGTMYYENVKVKQVSHFQFAQEMVSVSQGDTSVDHDYCNLPAEDLQREPAPLNSYTLRQKLHSLEEKMTLSQGCTWQPETVFMFLDTIDHYIDGKLDENDVTETVLTLLEAKHSHSVYSSKLLNAISQWLGQQFHAANISISHQVESFKVQHIERISDLPPAEELVTELFPEAMQTLLLYWMGLSEESSLEKRHSEYPILLLILEFANHNLITGVAHVLYSSLICK